MVAFVAALALTQTFAAHGLALRAPASWHPIGHRLTPCTDPAQRLALAGPQGELVVIVERVGYPARHSRPRRPRIFRLARPPEYIACCAPRPTKGWFFTWVERRRELYMYVYVGRARREHVERILNSLGVAPR